MVFPIPEIPRFRQVTVNAAPTPVEAESADEPLEEVSPDATSQDTRRRDFTELLRLAREPLEIEVETEVAAAIAPIAPAEPTPDPALEILAERAAAGERVALAAVEALGRFAEKPPAPAPQLTTHMHLPDHALTLHHHDGDLTLEPHSHTTVEPARLEPKIDVHAAEPSQIDVHVPAPEQPEIHVHVPKPTPRSVKVEYDDDGFKHYVVEDEPDAAA